MWSTKVRGSQKSRVGGPKKGAARRRVFFCLLISVFCLLSAGCRMDMQDQPRYEAYEPSDRVILTDGQSSRPLVEGTVPRVPAGQQYADRQSDYLYTGKMPGAQAGGAAASQGQGAGQAGGGGVGGAGVEGGTSAGGAAQGGPDVFPFPVTEAVLARGQDRYNNFCAMCHGMTGNGDGLIWRRGFQKPPSFHEDRLQEGQAAASHFFDVITNGFGAMASYNEMIPPEDRWAVIAYIRVLQLSRRGTEADVPESERGRLAGEGRTGAGQPAPPPGGGVPAPPHPGGDDH